jgi:hypothetical protein
MLKELFAALALSAASLLAIPIASHAAPAIKPGVAAPAGTTHAVEMRGGGRMGGGISRGGMGRSFGGMGRGPRVGGFNRGPRVGGFRSGPGRSFYSGRGGPRLSGRGSRGFKGYAGRHHHKHHRRFRGYAFYGLPYVYAYSAYDGYGCSYLRHRALRTGSSYWWRRYEECRYGYEY